MTKTAIVTTDDNVSVYSESEVTDYVGNKVYKDGKLKMILIDGGYIEKGNYYYYLTDHLGNNRVVTNYQGKIIQKTHYEPFGKAFEEEGLDKQPYLFGGKEFYAQHGPELYDSQARWYDPDGWFPTQDPLAEKYYPWSPYAYVMNNPLRNIDPDGRDVVILNAPKGAGGRGHMGAIIQDKGGQWHYITMGAAEGGLSKMFSEGVQGGMTVQALGTDDINEALSIAKQDTNNAEYTESVSFTTSSEMDEQTFNNASEMKDSINKGDTKYNAVSNNCADAVVKTISSGTGVNISTTSDPRPNSVFKNISDNQAQTQTNINTKVSQGQQRQQEVLKKTTDYRGSHGATSTMNP